MTNLEILLNRSRWNSVPITKYLGIKLTRKYSDYVTIAPDYELLTTVSIFTTSLSINVLTPECSLRHKIIFELHCLGFSDNDISDYLNVNNIKTPHKKKYYPSLIWSTRKKMSLRNLRINDTSVNITNIQFNKLK